MRAVERRLRERIAALTEEVRVLEEDRTKLRGAFSHLFRETLRILGEGKTWNMAYLVEHLAKTMAKFQWWYW